MDGEATNLFRAEDGAAIRFYTKAVKNNFLSEKLGRPVFDTGTYVEVITPGSNESVPEFLIERKFAEEMNPGGERMVEKTEYAKRYETQYDAYKRQTGENQIDGTPIEAWALIDAGTAATIKAQGIFTVEQLSIVSDGNLGNLGIGGREMRERAKAFLQAKQFAIPVAETTAKTEQVQRELDVMTADRDNLRAQLAEMQRNANNTPPPAQPTLGSTDQFSLTGENYVDGGTPQNADPFSLNTGQQSAAPPLTTESPPSGGNII